MGERQGLVRPHRLLRRASDGPEDRRNLVHRWHGNVPIGDTGVALIGHVGYLDVRHDGNDNDFTTGGKVSYTDWKLGVSYTVPDRLFKNVEIGAYYTGNDASKRFYTDLTGYDTAKDGGVYVKKTF